MWMLGLSGNAHQVASADYHIQRRDTPDQISAADNTASRSVPHLLYPAY